MYVIRLAGPRGLKIGPRDLKIHWLRVHSRESLEKSGGLEGVFGYSQVPQSRCSKLGSEGGCIFSCFWDSIMAREASQGDFAQRIKAPGSSGCRV